MITMHSLIGLDCSNSPIPQATNLQKFKIISSSPELAEIARTRTAEPEIVPDSNSPQPTRTRQLNRGIPTPALTPSPPRF